MVEQRNDSSSDDNAKQDSILAIEKTAQAQLSALKTTIRKINADKLNALAL